VIEVQLRRVVGAALLAECGDNTTERRVHVVAVPAASRAGTGTVTTSILRP
jgi:hypothetical protein